MVYRTQQNTILPKKREREKNQIFSFATIEMNLEHVMLSEIRGKQQQFYSCSIWAK